MSRTLDFLVFDCQDVSFVIDIERRGKLRMGVRWLGKHKIGNGFF